MVRKKIKYKTILSTNMKRVDQPREEGNTSLCSYFSQCYEFSIPGGKYRNIRPEAFLQENVFWKYPADLRENTHAEKRFATLLKSHIDMDVLL